MVSDAAATAAMGLARGAIERRLATGTSPDARDASPEAPPELDERRGVFVTLTRFPGGALRGCIGFPLPVYPLKVAVPRAAVAAAVDDPRFPPLTPAELPTTRIEISVLTVPERIEATEPAARLAAVRVGVDGLILEAAGGSGLLLPQVAEEEGWSAERFLGGIGEKAGLGRTAWRRPDAELYRFQAERFEEERPGGPTVRPSPAR